MRCSATPPIILAIILSVGPAQAQLLDLFPPSSERRETFCHDALTLVRGTIHSEWRRHGVHVDDDVLGTRATDLVLGWLLRPARTDFQQRFRDAVDREDSATWKSLAYGMACKRAASIRRPRAPVPDSAIVEQAAAPQDFDLDATTADGDGLTDPLEAIAALIPERAMSVARMWIEWARSEPDLTAKERQSRIAITIQSSERTVRALLSRVRQSFLAEIDSHLSTRGPADHSNATANARINREIVTRLQRSDFFALDKQVQRELLERIHEKLGDGIHAELDHRIAKWRAAEDARNKGAIAIDGKSSLEPRPTELSKMVRTSEEAARIIEIAVRPPVRR